MPDIHKTIVFKTTYLTFKAERAFNAAGIGCKVVTKPREISSDCGLAVRVSTMDEARAVTLLRDKGIEYLGIW